MPEIPDLESYASALRPRLIGARLENIRIKNPFFLRSVDPPLEAVFGRTVTDVRRFQKRILIELEGQLFLLIHLMIAGRLHWYPAGGTKNPRAGLATFAFTSGSLVLTEAGTKRRASLHVLAGEQGLATLDRGGIEVETADIETFRAALTRENHTLKRALTDPRLFSGIGNAYSDEILHAAKLSPFKPSNSLTQSELDTLFTAIKDELSAAIKRADGLAAKDLKGEKKSGLRVHGRTGEKCDVCGDTIAEVSFADSSLQYCPTCQTGGKKLADRRLSKLLK